jgi:hypothetical protein
MRNILGIESNLICRYGGLTGIIGFKVLEKQVFDLLDFSIFGLARGRKLTNYMHA